MRGVRTMTSRRGGRYERLERLEEVRSAYRPELRPKAQQSSSFLTGLSILAIALGTSRVSDRAGAIHGHESATALRIIARAVPAMTEEDTLLVLHGADLQAQAKADLSKPVFLPGFPVNVSIPARAVAGSTPQQIEVLLSDRAAGAIYRDGLRAFTATGNEAVSVTGPVLSSTWTMHQALTLMNARTHARFGQIALVLGLLLVVLIALFCLRVGVYARIAGVGMAGVGASLVAGVITLFLWLMTQLNYNSARSPLGTGAGACWLTSHGPWHSSMLSRWFAAFFYSFPVTSRPAWITFPRLPRSPLPRSSNGHQVPLERLRSQSLNRVPRRSSPPN